jgi:hypothetical protein
MNTNLIIVDNFYNNPDETREWALKQDFKVRGNFPGQRTLPVPWSENTKNIMQKILATAAGPITHWPTGSTYNAAFQYTIESDESWIHSDTGNTWAGVCYLTPNAPVSGGTGLFKHKKTGWIRAPRYKNGKRNENKLKKHIFPDTRNYDKWDMTAMVGNVYNRLVLYRGDLFHRSLDYFGKDINDGRLFQTFFFNTKF